MEESADKWETAVSSTSLVLRAAETLDSSFSKANFLKGKAFTLSVGPAVHFMKLPVRRTLTNTTSCLLMSKCDQIKTILKSPRCMYCRRDKRAQNSLHFIVLSMVQNTQERTLFNWTKRDKSQRAKFQGRPLFQATYNRKTTPKKNN